MKENYFVLYRRDVPTEKSKEYGERMLYDKCKEFEELPKAREFTLFNLPATLVQRYPLNPEEVQLRSEEKPYLVAAKYTGKYTNSCMGETEAMDTYDALRCNADEVESTIEQLAGEEKSREVLMGLELKLLG